MMCEDKKWDEQKKTKKTSKQRTSRYHKKIYTTFLRTPDQTTFAPLLVIEAVGRRYQHTALFVYLGNKINETADISFEIDRQIRLIRAFLIRYGPELHDRTTTSTISKVQTLMAEVFETLLFMCMTWICRADTFEKLQKAHHYIYPFASHWLPAPTSC